MTDEAYRVTDNKVTGTCFSHVQHHQWNKNTFVAFIAQFVNSSHVMKLRNTDFSTETTDTYFVKS